MEKQTTKKKGENKREEGMCMK